jgi:D-psicose/D-tagatose/L-ribulose 3-epimerase
MRYGVNAWVWTSPVTTEVVAELAPHVKAMGFDWFEIPLESLDDMDHARGGQILRDLELGVSACAAVGPDRDLIHPDESIRLNGAEYIRQAIVATQALGATNLIGPMYSAVGRTWQQTPEERAHDLDLLVKTLRELAAFAADHGVVLCLEPLNRFETSFINLAEQMIEAVDRVDHPACQIMLDTFHMNIEERSLGAAIRSVGPRLKHVHTCENDRGAPGSGHVPWNDVAQALKDIGYDGPVVIESFTPKVKSIARAAAVWRSFAPSSDVLAADGLAYLKQLFAH